MITNIDKFTEQGCSSEKKDKVCRSRGGESCAFDGAMIVLQPIADTAHIVHGPIACCGNSWEGRGTLSSRGDLHRMGFTTDLNEIDIVYGAERKLYNAILKTAAAVNPKAVFVYATCVSGMTGEDIESVCRDTGKKLGIPVIPVNAPGFVGPKNLGNRIAGEVLLNHVIGTGSAPTPPFSSPCQGEDGRGDKLGVMGCDINLIGEYNIAGDLWLIEPVLKRAGINILSRITGDATFEEITWAHEAKLNVVVCSRALINVAKEMEKKYGIPYVEVSFFGKSEMARALRAIGNQLSAAYPLLSEKIEEVIGIEEKALAERLKPYAHLRGKKALLYTGGVKSWSFISALLDLGMEIVGVGTKKSTFEDEEKMKAILGQDAPLIEDVAPKNLLRMLKERNADILVAGGRNQYLAVKEGYPFVDVNQERHTAYAGYDGLVNLAEAISSSIGFYSEKPQGGSRQAEENRTRKNHDDRVLIDPLKHSPAIGAAMAFQGLHRAVPIIHGAQGCNFLGKVLLTRHFREPISMVSSKLFAEDVVMGSEDNLFRTVDALVEKNSPEIIGIVSTGLTEVKGDDIVSDAKSLSEKHPAVLVLPVQAPDYAGGLEQGYAAAVGSMLSCVQASVHTDRSLVNIIAGPHLTPADVYEMKDIIGSFGLRAIVLPDLSALDGSRQGISPLAEGGTSISALRSMGEAVFTFAVGACMEASARKLRETSGIEYSVLASIAGLADTDSFMKMLSIISGREIPSIYQRQRRILVDALRDAHFFTAGKSVCLALDESQAVQTSRWVAETGARVRLTVVPHETAASGAIYTEKTICGGLGTIEGDFDLIISNSHASGTAARLGVPHYEMGFPILKSLGYPQRLTTGYAGTIAMINDIANLLAKEAHP